MENPTPNKIDYSAHFVRLLFVALAASFIMLMLYGIHALSIPIGIAFLLTFALMPAVDFIEGLGIPRWIAVALIVAGFIAVTWLFFSIVVPPIVQEFATMIRNSDLYQLKLSEAFESLHAWVETTLPDFIPLDYLNLEYIARMIFDELSTFSQSILAVLPNIITYSIITPVIILIFLYSGHEIYASLLAMVPNRYFEMTLLLANRIKNQILDYLRALSIQWMILMTIYTTGFYAISLPSAPLLGAIGATFNIIPYLGPLLGLLPPLAVSLISSSGFSIPWEILIVWGIAQGFDNGVTQPIILSRSVSIPPLVGILALITFQQLFGVVGMIVAIPLTGIVMLTIGILYRSLKAFKII